MSRWNTVAIYGVGLIGGSIGMALRKRNLANKIVGIGRNSDRLQAAVELQAIDEGFTELAYSPPPDLVVLCAPVQLLPNHCASVFEQFPEAIVTDAGSTKESMVRAIEEQTPRANFIGSHPLAGSDKSGVEYSNPDLFVDRMVILTPTEHTNVELETPVTQFWESIGAKTCSMPPDTHDQALAITSHLPHVVAAALAAETPEAFLHLIAGGWKDSTRIAAADLDMWTQILQENNQNVLAALQSMQTRLKDFEQALSENNRESIERLLAAGKQRRDALGS